MPETTPTTPSPELRVGPTEDARESASATTPHVDAYDLRFAREAAALLELKSLSPGWVDIADERPGRSRTVTRRLRKPVLRRDTLNVPARIAAMVELLDAAIARTGRLDLPADHPIFTQVAYTKDRVLDLAEELDALPEGMLPYEAMETFAANEIVRVIARTLTLVGLATEYQSIVKHADQASLEHAGRVMMTQLNEARSFSLSQEHTDAVTDRG